MARAAATSSGGAAEQWLGRGMLGHDESGVVERLPAAMKRSEEDATHKSMTALGKSDQVSRNGYATLRYTHYTEDPRRTPGRTAGAYHSRQVPNIA